MTPPDAADLLQQPILLDEPYQIWECQSVTSRPKKGAGILRYSGTVGPQCRGCGAPKTFEVEFSTDDGIGAQDVLSAIQEQLE